MFQRYPCMLDHADKPSIRVEDEEQEAIKVAEGYYYYDPNHQETDEEKITRIDLALKGYQDKINTLLAERKTITDNQKNMAADEKVPKNKGGRPKKVVDITEE